MKEVIQALAATGDEIYAKICEVISVDKINKTADLKPLDGSSDILDAYLVTDDENGGLYLEPKIGSLVCVVFVTKAIAVMVSPSELVKMQLKIEGVELNIDKDGFLLKKENETLKKLMGDFIQACRNMVFQTNSGVTIKLLNDIEFQNLVTRFNQFLK